MIFRPLSVAGAYAVIPELITDERGSFARTVNIEEFTSNDCDAIFIEQSIAFNLSAGTLRGMHYQRDPYGEGKLVRCTRGAVFDVIVDARRHSPTFGQWFAQRLDGQNRIALYMPPGVAHGYITLEDGAELLYAMTTRYVPEAAAGFRYDDDRIGIPWPIEPLTISERDLRLPPFPGVTG